VKEYIDRVAALREWPLCDEPADAYQFIKSFPISDVRPVMHGKWIDGKCNKCGSHSPFWPMASTYYESKYCPNCGADMREINDEAT